MMKHRETTMNHDEKLKKKTMKNDETQRSTNTNKK